MCRLLLYQGAPPDDLLALATARYAHRRGRLFGLSKGERLHGFGVAWRTDRGAAAVVTTKAPLDDLNVRRVGAATTSGAALAHVRSCACDTCPATTYIRRADLSPMNRGDAAGAAWIVRGDDGMRWRGRGFG